MEKKEYEEKVMMCRKFINEVIKLVSDSHILVGSCNHDLSCYLIPKGTERYLTYYGKPYNSLRFSDHWNWYSSTNRCSKEHYIQCESLNMPKARRREEAGKPTKPRFGIQIAYYNKGDKKYHHVFGDKYNRVTKTWEWVEADPHDVANRLKGS